jgi:hypothetical protein
MNRTYAAMILATGIALPLGACGDDSGGGYSSYGYAGGAVGCGQYTTCGTCTPVVGCGWCFNKTGGACTTNPDECAQVTSEFTWTWDPSGCPDAAVSIAPADAGGQAKDAGAPHVEAGAAQNDTGAPQQDAAPAPSDSGAPPPDGGALPSDAGASPTDASAD